MAARSPKLQPFKKEIGCLKFTHVLTILSRTAACYGLQTVTDNEEPDYYTYWMHLMNKSHGYGGIFNSGTPKQDTHIVELSTAREWQKSILAEFGLVVGDPKINTGDPPDCFVLIAGHQVSVELVQLVDPDHKSRSMHGETPHAGSLFTDMLWSSERFKAALEAKIQEKGEKYKKRELRIDTLVIHTAETWLEVERVEEWLKVINIQPHMNIGCAFLLFDYRPNSARSRHWPVFRLYGQLPDETTGR
jgi:hypothetical protein